MKKKLPVSPNPFLNFKTRPGRQLVFHFWLNTTKCAYMLKTDLIVLNNFFNIYGCLYRNLVTRKSSQGHAID